jgi:aryl-alcohol dehydrogenase-like predicted oxidoreductase
MKDADGFTWSRLALGCEALGGEDWGHVDLASVRTAVRTALDAGVSVFDTADVYGLGKSEQELALALGADRHRVTIVTKGGIRWADRNASGRAPTRTDSSAAYLTRAIDDSLRRLNLDTIPVYLVHKPDPSTPIDETIDCLERACDAGKLRAYGLSNFSLGAIGDVIATSRISVIEEQLNLLSPASVLGTFSDARALGLATLAYGPLAQGLLTGKYRSDSAFLPSDRRHRLSHFSADAFGQTKPILDCLRAVSEDVGVSWAQVAVRWTLESSVVATVIVGAKGAAQVLDILGALDWSLSREQAERLNVARRQAALG